MPIVVLLSALVGLWPHAGEGDYYQHEARGTVTIRASFGTWLTLDGVYGLGWWGRPDAKIRGSFLNLEASRTLERVYGVEARLGERIGWGLNVARRGVDELDRVRVWGQPVTDTTHAWSIGYHDGLRLLAYIQPYLIVYSPYVYQWHGNTLPWHAWQGQARYGRYTFDFGVGGPRDGIVADLGARWQVVEGMWVGGQVGWIEPPGWGKDVFRAAGIVAVGR
jgi:hypothetical protein